MPNKSDFAVSFGISSGLGTVVLLAVCAGLYGCPSYSVYSAKMAGEAELAQATQNKQSSFNKRRLKKKPKS